MCCAFGVIRCISNVWHVYFTSKCLNEWVQSSHPPTTLRRKIVQQFVPRISLNVKKKNFDCFQMDLFTICFQYFQSNIGINCIKILNSLRIVKLEGKSGVHSYRGVNCSYFVLSISSNQYMFDINQQTCINHYMSTDNYQFAYQLSFLLKFYNERTKIQRSVRNTEFLYHRHTYSHTLVMCTLQSWRNVSKLLTICAECAIPCMTLFQLRVQIYQDHTKTLW